MQRKNWYRIQNKNYCCLDYWVTGSYQTPCHDLKIQFSGKEFPDRYQTDTKFKVKTHVAWIPGWELSDSLLWVSDLRFCIGSFRPISNRYRIQSKIVVIWITGWQGSTRLSGTTLDSVFWKGVSRPISNRYRIQRTELMLPGFLGGSSLTCFHELQFWDSG